jgi:Bacterial pre-peptidase C-terminal domain
LNRSSTFSRNMREMPLILLPLLALIPAWGEELKLPDMTPFVNTVLPAGGQPDTSVEITARGRNLDGLSEIRFARPDISAEICSSGFYEFHAVVHIGPKVPPGLYEFRAITTHGNYVGRFHVGVAAAIQEKEPNNDISTTQNITLPVTVDGVIDEADYDHYRFHADAGETIVLDVIGNRASSFLDAKLAVLDENGSELGFNDDWHLAGDPHLAFTAPKTAEYIVQVSDASEFGDKDFSYRLIGGTYPFADRVLPAGVQRAATTELEMIGANLDQVSGVMLGENQAYGEIVRQERGRLTVRLAVPDSVNPGVLPLYLLVKGEYAPAPASVLVSNLPETRATEPGTRNHPHPIQGPSAVTAILDRDRTAHYYSFQAGAGETLAFAVDSAKLGYPLDAVLALYDSEGRQIAFQDDTARLGPRQPPEIDPYLTQKFEQDGVYLAMVRESGQRGAPNYVYRLSIQPVEPDFMLTLLDPSATLFRGRGDNKLEVRVTRLNGWDVPVEVWVDNPPAGVEITKAVAEPKDSVYKDGCAKPRTVHGTDVELSVRVPGAAASGVFPVRLHARGVMSGRTVEHTTASVYSTNFFSQIGGPFASAEVLAAVTDLPRLIIDVPQTFNITAGKKDKLKVAVTRFAGTAEALTLEAEDLPEGVTIENNILEPDHGQVELRFVTNKEMKAGKHNIVIRAGGIRSPLIELTVAAAPEDQKEVAKK